MNKKYFNEYKQSNNKEEFVKLLLSKYKDIKKQTALRRWYDFKIIVDEEVLAYVEECHPLKLLTLQDMIKYKQKITREYLKKYGFNDGEINWLIYNKFIKKM